MPAAAGPVVKGFLDAIHVVDLPDASPFASALFRDCFGADFPTPPHRDESHRQTRMWHQYVAFYQWTEAHIEPVGFCNWIRHGEVYLEGGMCVRPNFYRRLPKDHWTACKTLGGVAQIIMEVAATELNDAAAWFGYCGDRKAFLVDSRVGYQPTKHPFLIVRWFRELPVHRQDELVSQIAALGPF